MPEKSGRSAHPHHVTDQDDEEKDGMQAERTRRRSEARLDAADARAVSVYEVSVLEGAHDVDGPLRRLRKQWRAEGKLAGMMEFAYA
jgi:hypothetical protein